VSSVLRSSTSKYYFGENSFFAYLPNIINLTSPVLKSKGKIVWLRNHNMETTICKIGLSQRVSPTEAEYPRNGWMESFNSALLRTCCNKYQTN
jgi:hypothetical protein